jgi:hypothetical protein
VDRYRLRHTLVWSCSLLAHHPGGPSIELIVVCHSSQPAFSLRHHCDPCPYFIKLATSRQTWVEIEKCLYRGAKPRKSAVEHSGVVCVLPNCIRVFPSVKSWPLVQSKNHEEEGRYSCTASFSLMRDRGVEILYKGLNLSGVARVNRINENPECF